MNRFLAGCFSLFLAAFVAGCSDDDNAPRDLVLSDDTQTTQTVYADQTSGTGGGISFTALSDWTATVTDVTDTKAASDGTVDWLTLSAYSGGPGQYTLTLTLTENRTGRDRKAQIEIVCGADRITITVEQKGTTTGGDTPTVPQGNRLSRMEYTSVDSNNPDYYTKIILTFAYNREGLLDEVHDIVYYGDEQAYYSDDIYAFGYDENARLQRIERHSDYGSDYAYVVQTNDAGDITLLYEDTGNSAVTAWRFDYDENRYLQKAVENNTYEPDNDGDDDDDDVVITPGEMPASTRAFNYERLTLTWQDGNLMHTAGEYGRDFMDWEYTSYPNETPGLDFNVMSTRPLFGNSSDTYYDLVNMLFSLRLLGQNSKNLVTKDLVNWGYASSPDPEPGSPEPPAPTTETTREDYWEPFEYSFTPENYLSRVTARAVMRSTTTEIATGQIISVSESYYNDEYIFIYE